MCRVKVRIGMIKADKNRIQSDLFGKAVHPEIILIDGGKGRLNAALEVLMELGIINPSPPNPPLEGEGEVIYHPPPNPPLEEEGQVLHHPLLQGEDRTITPPLLSERNEQQTILSLRERTEVRVGLKKGIS